MNSEECSIEGCDRPTRPSGDMCLKHYKREWARRSSGYYERQALIPEQPDCVVEGCPKPRRSSRNPYCEAHYYRNYRLGDPMADVPVRPRRTGDRVCAAEGCGKVLRTAYWCAKHEARIRRHGDPETVLKTGGPQPTGPDNPTWKGDAITSYSSIHNRLRKYRGPASDRTCADCGGPAREWSYTGGCYDERVREDGIAWCPHTECYVPRCKVDHSAYDRALREAAFEDAAFTP